MNEAQKNKIYAIYDKTKIGILTPTPADPNKWEFGSPSMSIFTETLDDHLKRMNRLCRFKINKEEFINMWNEDIKENVI